MQAIVLAGGKGSRLGQALPKALTKVGGLSMLDHVLGWLSREDVRDVVIATGHGGDLVETAALESAAGLGLRVRCRRESKPLGTAGAARALLDLLEERFVVVYADVLAAVDLGSLLDAHRRSGADATLVAHPNDHPFDSDRLVTTHDGRVVRLVRRDDNAGAAAGALASAALYVVERAVLERTPDDGAARDFAHDVFPAEIARGSRVFAYRTSEYLKDMGTPERRTRVEADLRGGIPPLLRRHGRRDGFLVDRDGVLIEDNPLISKTEEIRLLPGVADALGRLNRARVAVGCCTNQPVVARGEVDEARLHELHTFLEGTLGAAHAWVDSIFTCPHHPDRGFEGERPELKFACRCRKPRGGLLDDAVETLGLRRSTSVFVGDRTTDLAAARAADMIGIGVLTGTSCRDGLRPLDVEALLVPDLARAADFFLHAPGSVAPLLDRIVAHEVVLLGGPSRSGKTLVANALRLALGRRGILALHVGLDRFLVPHEARDPGLGFEGRLGFDAAKRAAVALAEGEAVLVPGYDPRTRSRAAGLVMQRASKTILIVDGLLATEVPLDGALRIALTDDEPRLQARRTSFYAWKRLPEPTDAAEERARVARATDGAHVRLRVMDDYEVKEIP